MIIFEVSIYLCQSDYYLKIGFMSPASENLLFIMLLTFKRFSGSFLEPPTPPLFVTSMLCMTVER